jgi:hypothetical protein
MQFSSPLREKDRKRYLDVLAEYSLLPSPLPPSLHPTLHPSLHPSLLYSAPVERNKLFTNPIYIPPSPPHSVFLISNWIGS